MNRLKYLWIVCLLLLPLIHAATVPVDAVFMEEGNVVSTEHLTFEETNDTDQIYRCYMPATQLNAMAGSKIYIEGGASVVATTSSKNIVEFSDATTSPAYRGESTGAGSTIQNATSSPPTENVEEEEDLVSGQLLDAEGKPLGGETVRIEWEDENGDTQSITTTTLTAQEASRLGDSTLIGYYFFNKKRIGGAEYRVVHVINEEEENVLKSTPPKPATQDAKPVPEAPPPPPAEVEEVERPVTVKEMIGFAQLAFESIIDNWLLFLILIVLGLSVWAYFRYRKHLARAWRILFIRRQPSRLTRNAARLFNQDIRDFIQEDVRTIHFDASVRELISTLLANEEGYVVIRHDEAYRGFVTMDDALRVLIANPEVQSLEPFIRQDRIRYNMTVRQALLHLEDVHILPVVKEGKIMGIIDRERLLGALDEVFSLSYAEAKHMPTVREVMEEGFLVAPNTDLKHVAERIQTGGIPPVYILRKKQLMGVLDTHRLLEEVFKYHQIMTRMDVSRLMVHDRHGIGTDATVFEANKVLLERRVHTIPVVKGEELIGVITQKAIMQAMRRYLHDVV